MCSLLGGPHRTVSIERVDADGSLFRTSVKVPIENPVSFAEFHQRICGLAKQVLHALPTETIFYLNPFNHWTEATCMDHLVFRGSPLRIMSQQPLPSPETQTTPVNSESPMSRTPTSDPGSLLTADDPGCAENALEPVLRAQTSQANNNRPTLEEVTKVLQSISEKCDLPVALINLSGSLQGGLLVDEPLRVENLLRQGRCHLLTCTTPLVPQEKHSTKPAINRRTDWKWPEGFRFATPTAKPKNPVPQSQGPKKQWEKRKGQWGKNQSKGNWGNPKLWVAKPLKELDSVLLLDVSRKSPYHAWQLNQGNDGDKEVAGVGCREAKEEEWATDFEAPDFPSLEKLLHYERSRKRQLIAQILALKAEEPNCVVTEPQLECSGYRLMNELSLTQLTQRLVEIEADQKMRSVKDFAMFMRRKNVRNTNVEAEHVSDLHVIEIQRENYREAVVVWSPISTPSFWRWKITIYESELVRQTHSDFLQHRRQRLLEDLRECTDRISGEKLIRKWATRMVALSRGIELDYLVRFDLTERELVEERMRAFDQMEAGAKTLLLDAFASLAEAIGQHFCVPVSRCVSRFGQTPSKLRVFYVQELLRGLHNCLPHKHNSGFQRLQGLRVASSALHAYLTSAKKLPVFAVEKSGVIRSGLFGIISDLQEQWTSWATGRMMFIVGEVFNAFKPGQKEIAVQTLRQRLNEDGFGLLFLALAEKELLKRFADVDALKSQLFEQVAAKFLILTSKGGTPQQIADLWYSVTKQRACAAYHPSKGQQWIVLESYSLDADPHQCLHNFAKNVNAGNRNLVERCFLMKPLVVTVQLSYSLQRNPGIQNLLAEALDGVGVPFTDISIIGSQAKVIIDDVSALLDLPSTITILGNSLAVQRDQAYLLPLKWNPNKTLAEISQELSQQIGARDMRDFFLWTEDHFVLLVDAKIKLPPRLELGGSYIYPVLLQKEHMTTNPKPLAWDSQYFKSSLRMRW